MRKYSLYAVCASMMLASCSLSEEENLIHSPESEGIKFSTYVGMNTPTRAMDKTTFSNSNVIGLNACKTAGSLSGNFTNNFMTNEALTKTGDGWIYDAPKFWPANTTDRISFVASYPNIQPSISNGQCSFSFNVNDEPGNQQDFMWSSITDAYRDDRNGTHQNGIQESPATTPKDKVTLTFKHALSFIKFNAKTDKSYSDITIEITDIIVKNLYGSGTYTLSSTLSEGIWAVSGEQTKTYDLIPTAEAKETVTATSSTVGNTMLVIPQTLNTTTSGASTVTIKYTVTYGTSSMSVNEERTFNLANTSITQWEQNKIYNYNFIIALDMITFDATIDSWSNSGSVSSDLTIQ